MAGVILVALDRPTGAKALLTAARQLADLSGATRINALVVRAPPETMVSPSEEVLTEQREAHLHAAEASRVSRVRTVFDAWSSDVPATIRVEWIDIDGIAELLVEERGRRADYIVVERPSHRDYGISWQATRAALFATDRPVVLVPHHLKAEFGRRIAIAWRNDERATKSVLTAIRAIKRPEHVFVLTGIRANAPTPELPSILAEHGVAAELHVLPIGGGPFGETLLRKAHELGADMLVMGAYQHTPIRELLLGGVTRYMLSHADIPVLMRH
jgi:nucleotide-binding universal stress UspA family protein